MHVCCADAVLWSVMFDEHCGCTDSVHALIRQDFIAEMLLLM